jgi:hypothetical protein
MRSTVRIALLIAVAAAAASAAGAATAPPWRAVAYSHKVSSANGQPVIHIRMPVGQVAGKRHPDGLGYRLVVRRQDGRLLRGWAGYMITCGGWKHHGRTAMGVKTPLTREIPFRAWRARSCVIDLGGNGLNGSDDVLLQLLCRSRAPKWCAPIPPN